MAQQKKKSTKPTEPKVEVVEIREEEKMENRSEEKSDWDLIQEDKDMFTKYCQLKMFSVLNHEQRIQHIKRIYFK